MIDQVWRTALSRWGDELWGLALLRTGNRARAQQALVGAFERVYTAKTPPTDAHTSLIHALLPPRRRWLPRLFRQRNLPPKLQRIGPTERMLLALWLVHGRSGDDLVRVSQLSAPVVQERLTRALVRFLPRRDIARRTKDGRAALQQWVAEQLRLTSEPLPDTLSPTTIAGWQQALSRVRDLLTVAVERQRLPAPVRDALEAAMTARDDEPPAWQQKLGWFALAALLLVVGWIFVRPNGDASTTAAPSTSSAPQQTLDAQTVVQNALDAWTTMPVSGTLHRRVWAVDERPQAHDQAHVTDVWLASDKPQYRVETRRDGKLIEWHVVDNRDQLTIDSDAMFNMCNWSYGASVIAPRTQLFTVPLDQVGAIRDERLRSGTYGEGYRMLRRAAQAPDLRSYGVRTEGQRVVITLGFRDDTTTPARTVLLLVDGRTYELQAVRELIGDAAQTTARDLWRLEITETVPTVPATLPNRERRVTTSEQVLDPACPGLSPEYVVSARRLAIINGRGWAQVYAPVPLPAQVEHAAFVSPSPMNGGYNSFNGQNVQVVLRSADGWLLMRPNTMYGEGDVAADGVQRGDWLVQFENDGSGSASISATVRRNVEQGPEYGPYSDLQFDIEASGWTREQVLDVVDRLQPVDERTWPTVAPQVLDPRPLPADVEQVLTQAQQAVAAPPPGAYHVTMDVTVRAAAQPNERTDPYHVPQSITAPSAWTVEQWATVENGTTQQFKQLATNEDSTLLSAYVLSPTRSDVYSAREGAAYQSSQGEIPYSYVTQMLGVDFVRLLLAWDTPITMTADAGVWRFEQELPVGIGEFSGRWLGVELLRNEALASFAPMDYLSAGDIVQRVEFDRAQMLPRRWEVVHRTTSGAETVLQTIDVRGWRPLPAPPDAAFWTMPPLPPETFLMNTDEPPFGQTRQVTTVDGPLSLAPPQRQLAWPDGSGLEARSDKPYRIPPDSDTAAWQYNAWSLRDATQLETMGLLRTTTYNVSGGTQPITMRQGPRAVLRAALRQSDGVFFTNSSTMVNPMGQSEQIQVTIAGVQYDAWLLRNATQAALVVEIDDMLLYINGPADYVGGIMLEQLPALQWEPVMVGYGGGVIEVQP